MNEGMPTNSDEAIVELPQDGVIDFEVPVEGAAPAAPSLEESPGFDYENDPNYLETIKMVEHLKSEIAALGARGDRAIRNSTIVAIVGATTGIAALTGAALALGSGPQFLSAFTPEKGIPALAMLTGSLCSGLLATLEAAIFSGKKEQLAITNWKLVKERTRELEQAVMEAREFADAELVAHGAHFDEEGRIQDVNPDDIARAAKQAEAAGKEVNIETPEEMEARLK